MATGILYMVATPIGNLQDITLRALDILKGVDIILCEDTRVSKKLLDHYQINKPLLSYHHHSDARKVKEIKELLESGKNLALITDAGTPGISDPGNMLISVIARERSDRSNPQSTEMRGSEKRGIPTSPLAPRDDAVNIITIPGPSAVTAALSISGFPTDKFLFLGFPPHKNKRQKFFKEVASAEHTVIFYESGHRITKCLGELKTVLQPNRQLVVCRELTKKFETIYRGTMEEISNQKIDERGEFVIVISL